MNYEDGLAIALLLWLADCVILLAAINSTTEKNLRTVGQRLSWGSRTPIPMKQSDTDRSLAYLVCKYLLVAFLGFVFAFFSWIAVAWYAGSWLYKRAKDSGAPEVVRNYRWKLRNVRMTYDEHLQELLKLGGQDSSEFDDVRHEWSVDMLDRGLSPAYRPKSSVELLAAAKNLHRLRERVRQRNRAISSNDQELGN